MQCQTVKKPSNTNWLKNATVVQDREEVLQEYVKEGSLLDCGVVDSWKSVQATEERLQGFATSLHEHLRQMNPDVLGVDIDAEGIELLRKRGYNVRCENVENMQLDEQFDTIVAGELIEHLPNPGLMLQNLREHLKPGGNLILSTCNPFYVKHHWNIWRRGDIRVHDEHTAWFEPHTISRLLHMSGFEVKRLAWIRKRSMLGMVKLWPAMLRHYFLPNFLVVASPNE